MNSNPLLIVGYVIAIAVELLLPLIVAFYIHRRFQVRWRFFVYGALVFFVSQIILRIPLVQLAQAQLAPTLAASQTAVVVWVAVLALTAGLVEEIGRWLGYLILIKHDRTWRVGLMYGAGHGGLESMLLVGGLSIIGLVSIIGLYTTDYSKLQLTAAQLAQIEQARQQVAGLAWWMPILGAYERFITVFFQIALSILVLQVFVRHSLWWLGIAIALHAVVDFAAVMASQRIGPIWTEVLLTALLPLSFWIMYRFRDQDAPTNENPPADASAAVPA